MMSHFDFHSQATFLPFYSLYSSLTSGKSINSFLYASAVLYELNMLDEARLSLDHAYDLLTCDPSFLIRTSSIKSRHSSVYKILHMLAFFSQLSASYYPSLLPQISSLEALSFIFEDVHKPWDGNPFLNNLSFRRQWHDSNIIMAVFSLSACFASQHDIKLLFDSIHTKLLDTQSPITGLHLSSELRHSSLLTSMAATFHYLPMYEYMQVPFPYQTSMLSSVLSLQTKYGPFCLPAGHSCIDYDAVYLLHSYLHQHNYTADDLLSCKISASLARLSTYYDLVYKNNRGPNFNISEFGYPVFGFSDYIQECFSLFLHNRCFFTFAWNFKSILNNRFRSKPISSNSDLACSSYPHESNLFSLWFYFLICRMLDSASNANKLIFSKFYSLPFLGYSRNRTIES